MFAQSFTNNTTTDDMNIALKSRLDNSRNLNWPELTKLSESMNKYDPAKAVHNAYQSR